MGDGQWVMVDGEWVMVDVSRWPWALPVDDQPFPINH
jgi:hypothetical protein